MQKIREECGIFGIISNIKIQCGSLVYAGLIAQQHRGQESAGIASFDGTKIISHKNKGLVANVFNTETIKLEYGNNDIAIGHVRYSTTGTNSFLNAQPIVTNHKKIKFALAHNGNLINAKKLRDELEEDFGVVFNTTNDSEVINMLLVNEMVKGNNFVQAIKNVVGKLEGAFSLVIMTKDYLIAVRDRVGFRPLCMGRTKDTVVFASESCALDSVGAELVRDINPGEIVFIDKNLNEEIYHDEIKAKKGLCSFEYIYFSRQDSIIDGKSVYQMRNEMGKYLAKQMPVDADMVCGVPDSGLEGAKGYAKEAKLPYESAFVLNRYIGRSFIYPTQEARSRAVNLKLNPLRAAIKDKRIVLVDDSIVRGTTCGKIIKVLREAGAKEIHMRITAPLFKYACYFGTDIDDPDKLIANQMDIEGIRKKMGADSLDFLTIENLKKILGSDDFCIGCFSGQYPIEIKEKPNKGCNEIV